MQDSWNWNNWNNSDIKCSPYDDHDSKNGAAYTNIPFIKSYDSNLGNNTMLLTKHAEIVAY